MIREQKVQSLENELQQKNEELENIKTGNKNQSSSNSSNNNFNYYAKGYGRFPQASDRYLNYSDINHLNKSQLKAMRNEIFARHGYIFKTKAMSQYFSGQSWYKPLYKDVTSKLTDIEKHNVNLIKQYE